MKKPKLNPKEYIPISEDLFDEALMQISNKDKIFYGDPKDPTKKESNMGFKIHKKKDKFIISEE